ncbi:CoA ester lyase [Paremcibacter congregatus]|uniref:HpcH/HpaI aldolase/citrate lyase family protein n=1 Tax=Paremcibacter congregatus TaxID=2043170 RepID=UPI0030EC5E8C|tara:strand:+ start:584 stop:1483 length:900 start_codon:yes stop_codon:yes gene_type:complete
MSDHIRNLAELSVRPRRSVLYMPGSNPRALEKAKSLAADGLILDLEDAVAIDAKVAARDLVCAAVKEGGYGAREVIIRVNGLDSPWGEADIKAACAAGPDAILLPKVESAVLVRQVEQMMQEFDAPAHTKIWCMMETPRGMLRAEEIAGASDRLTCFVMGTSDLVKDLHAHHTLMRLPVVTSLGLCLLAARAEGLDILDGVYLDLDDAEGHRASCQQGLEFGFDGKTIIHPKQLADANEIFAPSAAELEYAVKIIAAYQAAEKQGKGVVVVDGKLIENLHVENAKRLVSLADAIAALAE